MVMEVVLAIPIGVKIVAALWLLHEWFKKDDGLSAADRAHNARIDREDKAAASEEAKRLQYLANMRAGRIRAGLKP
jgi:hypothetical protein